MGQGALTRIMVTKIVSVENISSRAGKTRIYLKNKNTKKKLGHRPQMNKPLLGLATIQKKHTFTSINPVLYTSFDAGTT